MESANLKLTDQVVGSSSPPNLAAPSNCFGFGSNNHHAWSSSSSSSSSSAPNFSSCGSIGNKNPNYDIGIVSNSSTSTTSQKCSDDQNNINTNLVHLNNMNSNIMVQDLGLFPWNITSQSSYDMQLAKIKEELSESFPKFTELLNSPSSSNIDDYGHFLLASHIKNNNNNKDFFGSDSSCGSTTTITTTSYQNPLMVKALSSSCQINGHDNRDDDQIPGAEFDGRFSNNSTNNNNDNNNNIGVRGQFSQIYPSVNISNLNYQCCNSLKPALDHLASARFMGSTVLSDRPALNDNINLAVLRDHNVRASISNHVGLVHQMQQPHDRLSYGRSNQGISARNSDMTELAKRSSALTEPKTGNQLAAPNKKSRFESRTSCPPFKVRKEKLGDRIAALQQLVSPFGKTDTASVLMEAIGYIKFLQNQVETLSVPYMKSSRNKFTKTMQGGPIKEDGISEEPRRDLRSRGLCLVPLSCMSYVTGDHGGGGSIWPPPNFGGTT